jgi:hypothetical protein
MTWELMGVEQIFYELIEDAIKRVFLMNADATSTTSGL